MVAQKVMRFFPPIVTGPIIICIGLSLAGSAVTNCQTNWFVALVAVAALVGIFMNAVLPGKDYVFGTNDQGDTSVNFGTRQDGK